MVADAALVINAKVNGGILALEKIEAFGGGGGTAQNSATARVDS